MNFDDIPLDQIDEKYEELLSEYTRLKKEMNFSGSDQNGSAKSLSEQKSPSQNNLEDDISKIKQEIEAQAAKLSSTKSRHEAHNTQLEQRIRAQKAWLADSSQIDGHNQRRVQLLAEKEKAEAEIQRLTVSVSQDQQNLRNIQEEKRAAEEKSKGLAAQRESNFALQDQAKSQIEGLKKQAQETDKLLKSLKGQLEGFNSLGSNKTQVNPAALSQQLSKIEAQINQQKIENEKQSKQVQAEKDNLKEAERQTKESTDKEVALTKDLEKTKFSESKLRKLIEEHASQIKKKAEQKKDKKARQADAHNELSRVENENKFLENSIKWQDKKLADFMQIKKTYIDKSEIEGLNEKKKQFEKFNKNCEADVVKLKNLTKRKDELEQAVAKIKKQHTRIINEKEFQIKQMKERSTEQKKKKEEIEKKLTENKVKLEEYKKEYPNHELEKAKVAEQQKRKKAEEAKRKQEQMNALKSQTKKKVKPVTLSTEEEDLQKYLPRVASEDKSFQTMISNPTYQIAGVAILVGLVLVVYYAL